MGKNRIFIAADQCSGCGLCLQACARKLIAMYGEKAIIRDLACCSQCGHCKCVCPVAEPQLPAFDTADFTLAVARGQLPSPSNCSSFCAPGAASGYLLSR